MATVKVDETGKQRRLPTRLKMTGTADNADPGLPNQPVDELGYLGFGQKLPLVAHEGSPEAPQERKIVKIGFGYRHVAKPNW
jgi:hypothetical protein